MATQIVFEEREVVDGEVITHQERSYTKSSKVVRDRNKYFTILTEELHDLFKLSGSELKLFLFLASKMSFVDANNEADISTFVRAEAREALGISNQSIKNSLTQLRKKGFLVQVKESKEQLSPNVVFCGLISKVNENKRTFSSRLKKKRLMAKEQ